MNTKILIALLLIGSIAKAQPLPNHTFVNQQYRWVGGVFNNELKVPGYSGFPYTKPLTHSPMNGDIGYDSVNHRFYFRSGGTFRNLVDSATAISYRQRFGFVGEDARATANRYFSFAGNRDLTLDSLDDFTINLDRFFFMTNSKPASNIVAKFEFHGPESDNVISLLQQTTSGDSAGYMIINEYSTGISARSTTPLASGLIDVYPNKIVFEQVNGHYRFHGLTSRSDTNVWKPMVWRHTDSTIAKLDHWPAGSGGSSDITYSVFEDSCLVITDGFGSDTVCFTGGSGITQAQLDDSLADLRQVIADTASAIRADFPSASGGNPFADNTDLVKGSADATKLFRIEVDGFPTSTTVTMTPPASSFTAARTDAANTFTGTQVFSSNPTFSATSANRVLYTTTGGAITSTANFNFDGSFGRLAGQWSIGAVHSGTTNRNFEVTGYVNYANATAISGFIPYQQYGGWDGIGTISPSANILAVGGYRASQWIGLNLYSSGVARLNISATEMDINPTGVDHDFRVRSDNDANALVVDAGTDFVGVGIAPGSVTQKLHVNGNIRFSGALMPNNQAGNADQQLVSQGAGSPPIWQTQPIQTEGTWTPTVTGTANVSSASASTFTYSRNGDQVFFYGEITIDPTTTATLTTLTFTLHTTTTLTNTYSLSGHISDDLGTVGRIRADVAGGIAEIRFTPTDVTSRVFSVTGKFTYITP